MPYNPNVLSVCTTDSSGGAARAAYRIHRAVRDLGVNSRMFVKEKRLPDSDLIPLSEFIPTNPFYKFFDWGRNKVMNKWNQYIWSKYPSRSKFFMSDLRSTDIGHALNKLDYDILHLHWINQRFIPMNQLPKDKPIVWTLHDSWPFCGICHYFLDCEKYKQECGACPFLYSQDKDDLSHRVLEKKRRLYEKLDLHVVAPSLWLAKCAHESSLFGSVPITSIPNCIDTGLFRPYSGKEISPKWRYLQNRKVEKNYILYGAINATKDIIKGFSYLISALGQLDKSNVELLVFGARKTDIDIQLSFPVHYLGYINDSFEMASLYNIADVVVVPSLTENLSCTVMESLSCGKPVVAFNVGGNGDMINHKQNGYLAQEKDDEDLARGILWCLNHNAKGELSLNAREKVLNNYTPEIVGKAYADLYFKLI